MEGRAAVRVLAVYMATPTLLWSAEHGGNTLWRAGYRERIPCGWQVIGREYLVDGRLYRERVSMEGRV